MTEITREHVVRLATRLKEETILDAMDTGWNHALDEIIRIMVTTEGGTPVEPIPPICARQDDCIIRKDAMLVQGQRAYDELAAMLVEAEKYNGWHQQACLKIEDLRRTLAGVKHAIVNADPEVLVCTLWMTPEYPPETVVDHIDNALERNS